MSEVQPTPTLSPRGFTLKEETRPDGGALLRLTGALDADAAPFLASELERRLLAGQRSLSLDFRHVPFISSSGVGSLIASVGEFRDEGGEIVLCNLSDELMHVFDMLGLLDYVSIES